MVKKFRQIGTPRYVIEKPGIGEVPVDSGGNHSTAMMPLSHPQPIGTVIDD
jgi:hypothetical protein